MIVFNRVVLARAYVEETFSMSRQEIIDHLVNVGFGDVDADMLSQLSDQKLGDYFLDYVGSFGEGIESFIQCQHLHSVVQVTDTEAFEAYPIET